MLGSMINEASRRIARVLVCFTAATCAFVGFTANAGAASGFDHIDPNVTCRTSLNASGAIIDRRIFVESPPEMFVYGTTTSSPASWQPVLYGYNATTGTFTRKLADGPELSGYTSNGYGNGSAFGLPAWRGSFTVFSPGFTRVAILYRWYSGGSVIHSEFLWAATHSSDILQYTSDWHIAGGFPYTFSSTYYCVN